MNYELENDLELSSIIDNERQRQLESIELIASENYTSLGVMDCLGSILTNKYSEGRPNRRYYGGNEFIDEIELLCEKRALQLYKLDNNEWAVNVQPYSGSPANLAVYTGLLKPHDRIMGLDLPSGGHLTHGFYTPKKKISASSIFFESLPYHINETGYIDYDDLQKQAKLFNPKLIICGASAYPREFDYKRFREIANSVNALLMCDMSHYSGLIAVEEMNSPFAYCDIVSSTTHKTLRGPRSGMIFTRKINNMNIMVNDAVFPAIQGGPHNHQIAGVAFQLGTIINNYDKFKSYIQQVKRNSEYLSKVLIENGYEVMTGGSDCHIVLVSLKSKGITGSKMEKLCEYINISLNKNTVYGDKNPMNPSGIRVGTSAMTTRGMVEKDMEIITDYFNKLVEIGVKIQDKYGRKLVDFNKGFDDPEFKSELDELKKSVIEYSRTFKFYNK